MRLFFGNSLRSAGKFYRKLQTGLSESWRSSSSRRGSHLPVHERHGRAATGTQHHGGVSFGAGSCRRSENPLTAVVLAGLGPPAVDIGAVKPKPLLELTLRRSLAADVFPVPEGPCSRRFLGGLREPAEKTLEADTEDGGAGDASGAGCEFHIARCRRTPIGGR